MSLKIDKKERKNFPERKKSFFSNSTKKKEKRILMGKKISRRESEKMNKKVFPTKESQDKFGMSSVSSMMWNNFL